MTKRILIILADGFEEIEAVTVIDILRRSGADVVTAGLTADREWVTGAHDITLKTDTRIDSVQGEFDACVLPGGLPGAERLAGDPRVLSLISAMAKENKIVAAICAAPAAVLTQTEILNGRSATCYPGMEDSFPPNTTFKEDNVVIDGNLITSRGPGTALEFALTLVEQLGDPDKSQELKRKTLSP
ncbi:MAG: DJ-1 family glyoxalase III [Candidatus Omnitrophota bacterium]